LVASYVIYQKILHEFVTRLRSTLWGVVSCICTSTGKSRQ